MHTSEPYEYLSEQIRKVGGAACQANLAKAFESIEKSMLVLDDVEELQAEFGWCEAADGDWVHEEEYSGMFAAMIQLIIDQIDERQ